MEKKKRGRPKVEKPTNGHLSLQESKRTIVLAWGKYSITALCLTAIIVALIQKIRF